MISTRNRPHSLSISGPRSPRRHGSRLNVVLSCSRPLATGHRGQRRRSPVTTASTRRFSTMKPGARFAPKLVLQAYVRTQTTTSGWCQRLRSRNPLTRPIPNSHDASAQTELTSSVGSVIGKLSIDSTNSRLSPTTSGPGSPCGSVSGADHSAMDPNPKPVSRDGVSLTNES